MCTYSYCPKKLFTEIWASKVALSYFLSVGVAKCDVKCHKMQMYSKYIGKYLCFFMASNVITLIESVVSLSFIPLSIVHVDQWWWTSINCILSYSCSSIFRGMKDIVQCKIFEGCKVQKWTDS